MSAGMSPLPPGHDEGLGGSPRQRGRVRRWLKILGLTVGVLLAAVIALVLYASAQIRDNRAEAVAGELRGLAAALQAYHAEHGEFTTDVELLEDEGYWDRTTFGADHLLVVLLDDGGAFCIEGEITGDSPTVTLTLVDGELVEERDRRC